MEYSVEDVTSWVFTHPDAKCAIENFIYLCYIRTGDTAPTDKPDFYEAVQILQQIAAIGNPTVCRGMFTKACTLFTKACKTQEDEWKLLSYVGRMFCNHWIGQDHLNPHLQQEISMLEYKGSFWERHGDAMISLGSAAMAGIGMLCGMAPAPAAGCAAKGARGLLDSHSDSFNYSKEGFNRFRNAILSIKF